MFLGLDRFVSHRFIALVKKELNQIKRDKRIMLSLVCSKIAGAVPTGVSSKLLNQKCRLSKNAEGCPYPVDRRRPHAGTGRNGWRATRSDSDEDGSG